jgi:hypothetical protein
MMPNLVWDEEVSASLNHVSQGLEQSNLVRQMSLGRLEVTGWRLRAWAIGVLAALGPFFAAADSTLNGIGIPTPPAGHSRLEKPLFKGVEMYSWRDGRVWKFSLLIGTNRNKSEQEVMAKSATVTGLEQIKARLATLAVGEYVSWSNSGLRQKPFAYPSAAVIAELVRFCASKQIELSPPYGR